MKGRIILRDGKVFEGELLNDEQGIIGEVVFNTSMSGYQEVFTDPSYSGQIITMTYPLIGNYGILENQSESESFSLKAVIIHELYDGPIHPKAVMSLKEFLTINKIPTLLGVDTRALTKHIRSLGTTPGIITTQELKDLNLETLFNDFNMKSVVKENSSKKVIENFSVFNKHIALMDFGYKKSIYQELIKRGAKVTILPFDTSIDEIAKLAPDGVVLSNGPGDPEDIKEIIPTIKYIQDHFPTFGICLGHQLIAMANGAKTFKMSFGHRGSNHSVKDYKSGKVFLSAQNHSFAVSEDSLKGTYLKPRFINVNDKTIEGLEHTDKPVFSVQFHPEANAGPEDSSYLFDEFFELVNQESKDAN